jgi:hypothetical protein
MRRPIEEGLSVIWFDLERFTIGLRTLDTSPKRKRVHDFLIRARSASECMLSGNSLACASGS